MDTHQGFLPPWATEASAEFEKKLTEQTEAASSTLSQKIWVSYLEWGLGIWFSKNLFTLTCFYTYRRVARLIQRTRICSLLRTVINILPHWQHLCLHTHAIFFFPEPFESKLQTSCLFIPNTSVFPKDKDILLYSHSPVIKIRKFYIDSINIGTVI